MAQYQFQVEENTFNSLPELSEAMGVEKLTMKDVTGEGEYADIVKVIKVDEGGNKKPVNTDNVFTALTEEDIENLADVDPEEIKSTFPEFAELDELKEFIKDIDTPTLEYLATGLGLEWNPTYHAHIHRMRIAMAIQRFFFPDLFKPKESKKKKAKYGDYSTPELSDLATENDIIIKDPGNERIFRMKLITELKKAGILPE